MNKFHFQGDLDKDGTYFDNVVSNFNSPRVEACWKEFNPTNDAWGTHMRLLTAAAISVDGDIIEFGTGKFSTPLLHQIVEQQVLDSYQRKMNNKLRFSCK